MNVDEDGGLVISLCAGITIGTYELIMIIGALLAVGTATAVAATESKYHYIENGINSILKTGVQEANADDLNEHRKTKNGKNRLRNKHEKGKARVQLDNHGEKGDVKRIKHKDPRKPHKRKNHEWLFWFLWYIGDDEDEIWLFRYL